MIFLFLADIEYPDYNEVKDAAIFETNLLRKRYHASTLSWSDNLSDKAQKLAEHLAGNTDFNVNTVKRQPGQNVALVNLKSPNVGKDAVDQWANENRYYDFKSPLVTRKNSDFVQLMWKANKEFGMGVAKTKLSDGWIVTSVYDPAYNENFMDLRRNLQSDIPIQDPYGDIAG